MSNTADLYVLDPPRTANLRGDDRSHAARGWALLRARWQAWRARRRARAALDALVELDDHQLQDIGVDESLRQRAAAWRERREQPYARLSLRGIEAESRRLNW